MNLSAIIQSKETLEKLYKVSLGGGKDLKLRKLVKKFNEFECL